MIYTGKKLHNCIQCSKSFNHAANLKRKKSICSLIFGMSCTILNNAAFHLVELEIWRKNNICSFILGRGHTIVCNAITQPLKLVLRKHTLWYTINAISVDILQLHRHIWGNTKWPTLGKTVTGVMMMVGDDDEELIDVITVLGHSYLPKSARPQSRRSLQ